MTTYRSLQDYTREEIEERIRACEHIAERERAAGRAGSAVASLNHARNLRAELQRRTPVVVEPEPLNEPLPELAKGVRKQLARIRTVSDEDCRHFANEFIELMYRRYAAPRHQRISDGFFRASLKELEVDLLLRADGNPKRT